MSLYIGNMTSSDTLFDTARLTLDFSRQLARPPNVLSEGRSLADPDGILDRRKRKRDEESHHTGDGMNGSYSLLAADTILTPGCTPLPRPLTRDPPLLAHRYSPMSIAGDGAFSWTILAQDVIDPRKPIVAIKAMKPGFDLIGQQEYDLLQRIQDSPLPKHTNLPIVRALASFSASSTYHIVLEALESEPLRLPDCPHEPSCPTFPSCPFRQDALRKVASQLLLGLSFLHDQMGYIHADLKPDNILKCRTGLFIEVPGVTIVSPASMKLKIIDLGNAVPIDKTGMYYNDFEIQSIHYRAPEVLLGLPFTAAIDMFSLGLILAELILSKPPISPQIPQYRQPFLPTSPPQSHSPQPVHSLPLLFTIRNNRGSFIEQIIRLLGPLPNLYREGKFWSDEIAFESYIHGSTLLSRRLESEGVDPELIDFIMQMLHLDPERRISAREALRHEWLVGPLLGYWAVLGIDWTPAKSLVGQRTDMNANEEFIESRLLTPERPMSPVPPRKLPPLLDFSKIDNDENNEEEEEEEVSFVNPGSSPAGPLPFFDPPAKSVIAHEAEIQDDDEVLLL